MEELLIKHAAQVLDYGLGGLLVVCLIVIIALVRIIVSQKNNDVDNYKRILDNYNVALMSVKGSFSGIEGMVGEIKNRVLVLETIGGDIREFEKRINDFNLSLRSKQLDVLYSLHNKTDDDGIPIWYVPYSLRKNIEEIKKEVEEIDKELDRLKFSSTQNRQL